MSVDGQGTKRRRKITENFYRLSTAHQRHRQTDDRRNGDSISVTFANKNFCANQIFVFFNANQLISYLQDISQIQHKECKNSTDHSKISKNRIAVKLAEVLTK